MCVVDFICAFLVCADFTFICMINPSFVCKLVTMCIIDFNCAFLLYADYFLAQKTHQARTRCKKFLLCMLKEYLTLPLHSTTVPYKYWPSFPIKFLLIRKLHTFPKENMYHFSIFWQNKQQFYEQCSAYVVTAAQDGQTFFWQRGSSPRHSWCENENPLRL